MDIAAIDMDNDIIINNDPEKSFDNLLHETNKIIDVYYPNIDICNNFNDYFSSVADNEYSYKE